MNSEFHLDDRAAYLLGTVCAEKALKILFDKLHAQTGEATTTTLVDGLLENLHAFKSGVNVAIGLKKIELRSARNRLVPIHRLPAELLTDILLLSLAQHEWTVQSVQNLAKVCKSWLKVVVTSSLFWPQVTSEDSDGTLALILKRNAAGPLRIRYQWSEYHRMERFLQAVAPLSYRWQSLSILAGVSGPLMRYVDVPTPTLVDLFISIQASGGRTRFIPLQDSGGKHLRDVHVEGAYLPWESCRLTRLRSLQIRELKQGLPSIDQLYTILSSSAEIWCLVLTNWSVPEDFRELRVAEPKGPIHLPELSTLALLDIPSFYTEFLLSHIICPNCSCLDVDDIDIKPSTAILLSKMVVSAIPQGEGVRVRLGADSGGSCLLAGPLSRIGYRKSYELPETGVELYFPETSVPNRWEQLSQLLKDLPPLPIHVTIMGETSTGIPPYAGDIPLRVLQHLPSAPSLRFEDFSDIRPILLALTVPSEEDGSWLCPQLAELEMDHGVEIDPTQEIVAFANRGVGDDSSGRAPPRRLERVKVPKYVFKELGMTRAVEGAKYLVT